MSVWYQIFSESLTTHSRLALEDIVWASKLLASTSSELPKKTMFAMIMNRRTFTGLHARMFNATVDDIIVNRSVSRLSDLTNKSFINIYPELYDNSSLTRKDREVVKGIANDEYNATIMAVNSWNVEKTNILPHVKSKLPTGTVNLHKTSYIETYGIICYQSDNKYPKPVSNVRTKDPISGAAFCFNKNEIAVRFSQGDYSNPSTGGPLPPQVVNFIKKHLDLEIKLFGRPLDIAIGTPISESDLIPRNTPSISRPMMSPTYSDDRSSLPTIRNGRLLTPSEITGNNRSIKFNKAISTPRVDIETGYQDLAVPMTHVDSQNVKEESNNQHHQDTLMFNQLPQIPNETIQCKPIIIKKTPPIDHVSKLTPKINEYFISSPVASNETNSRDDPNQDSPVIEAPALAGISDDDTSIFKLGNVSLKLTPPVSIPKESEVIPPPLSSSLPINSLLTLPSLLSSNLTSAPPGRNASSGSSSSSNHTSAPSNSMLPLNYNSSTASLLSSNLTSAPSRSILSSNLTSAPTNSALPFNFSSSSGSLLSSNLTSAPLGYSISSSLLSSK